MLLGRKIIGRGREKCGKMWKEREERGKIKEQLRLNR
jgi:hypothetical protein